MVTIIDYGVGNLFSLISSFEHIGEEAHVTSSPEEVENAQRIILPGVGAFEDAIAKLRQSGLDQSLKKAASKGTPILGICLGMQLLFERSFEYGEHEGLSLIEGSIRPLQGIIPQELKIPHMGWNALDFTSPIHPLFSKIKPKDHVYFVHSFYATDCAKNLIASAEYGISVTAAVAKKNVMGCQFHPEKSGEVGLSILRSFCQLEAKDLC